MIKFMEDMSDGVSRPKGGVGVACCKINSRHLGVMWWCPHVAGLAEVNRWRIMWSVRSSTRDTAGSLCGPIQKITRVLQLQFFHSSILVLVVAARYTSSTNCSASPSICILPSPCLRQWPHRKSAQRRTTRKSRQQLDWWALVRSHPNSCNGRVVADI